MTHISIIFDMKIWIFRHNNVNSNVNFTICSCNPIFSDVIISILNVSVNVELISNTLLLCPFLVIDIYTG